MQLRLPGESASAVELHALQPIQSFALARHDGPYDKWPLNTPLLRDGAPTGAQVPGYVVEGQYRWRDAFVLITSFDCPFEESNRFLLLSCDLRVLASTQLGVPYGSFLLHAHWPVGESALRLHYSTRLFYTLTVEELQESSHARYRLMLTHDPEPERDPRSAASIADLEARLEAIRQGAQSRPEDGS